MMTSAKDIVIKPIKASAANDIVKKIHYSGKVTQNSQLHLGVFLNGKLEGAMQFGPSIDKRKTQALVTGTLWNEFIELNRMAFSDALPRNSESRALGIAIRLIKKQYPQIKWIISFSDGDQCGDGPPMFRQGFTCPALLFANLVPRICFQIRGYHPLRPDFPFRSSNSSAITSRLFPVRSPLLGESRLISFPPAT